MKVGIWITACRVYKKVLEFWIIKKNVNVNRVMDMMTKVPSGVYVFNSLYLQ